MYVHVGNTSLGWVTFQTSETLNLLHIDHLGKKEEEKERSDGIWVELLIFSEKYIIKN